MNAESGANAHAANQNTDGSYDVGLWQINDFNWVRSFTRNEFHFACGTHVSPSPYLTNPHTHARIYSILSLS
jgi:hypothetical protein